MRIILFCPPVTVINGGIKQIFALADTLCDQGYEAVVFEEQGRRPDWFSSHAPVVGQGVFAPRADEILILPEDQPQILSVFQSWPQRKVVYAQNQFYAALPFHERGGTYADYGVYDVLCCSRTMLDYVRQRHPPARAHLVMNGIDRTIFHAPTQPREKIIAYMPRKRPIEALFLKDQFRFTYPECADWAWQPIERVSAADVAAQMGRAGVFLSLSRMESLGLAPLEAMACGAVVAGFTGIGGREYARAENGFWVAEDDFPACLSALRQAVTLAESPQDAPEAQTYRAAAESTLADYTMESFASGARAALDAIAAP